MAPPAKTPPPCVSQGFEGRVLAYDPYPSDKARELGVSYVPLEQLLRQADVVSLHVPLLPSTRHIIGPANLKLLKPTALVINVSRGGLIDTSAAISSLTDGNLGGLAVDVYEGEGGCSGAWALAGLLRADSARRRLAFGRAEGPGDSRCRCSSFPRPLMALYPLLKALHSTCSSPHAPNTLSQSPCSSRT